jgi:hypothetical protein
LSGFRFAQLQTKRKAFIIGATKQKESRLLVVTSKSMMAIDDEPPKERRGGQLTVSGVSC